MSPVVSHSPSCYFTGLIFACLISAKALEAIKTERKNYAYQAKDLKAELEGLNSHKFAATGFREEVEDCMASLPLLRIRLVVILLCFETE